MSEASQQRSPRARMGKPNLRHVRWGLIGLIIVLVVAILAYVGINRPYSVTVSVKTTVMPEFSDTLKPIAGWKPVLTASIKSTSYYDGSVHTSRVVYVKNNVKLDPTQAKSTGSTYYGTCYVVYQTLLLPQYLAGAGDDFLSQSFLYSQEASYNSVPSKQGIMTVSTSTGRSLAFRTAYYKSGTVAAQGAASSYEGYFAVRGFDKVYTTTDKATTGQYETKTNKVLPVLGISYTCTNGGKLDPKLWPQFVAAGKVLLK